ncbi:low molecular weight protein-tyrosine-phosphatase [Pseudooceanicola nanhaiensis]|uniref:low molecular weight protein-tyrosine-phosphatase n=1 Tax=Pseudooceanicola nanhaiensis TaxID=375761 RepID=UPI001CD27939|nr:low molecular weight protein-tyrosine-phosphatase [Pseudooceanicola nanhaiensis]MCA0919448.1 low molecular weight phosphotyrosine protein phosphatase [Pseudooceanicola nanhaiensis]
MSDPAKPPRILFVCLGNICRSPAAEGVVQRMAEGRALELDSAGTGNWHVGEPPYGHMQRAAKQRGYDLSSLRARQVKVQDFKDFDLILAMDEKNLADLRALDPGTGAALRLFMEYAPQTGVTAVPDPYYTRDFDGALDLIEAAARGLLTSL